MTSLQQDIENHARSEPAARTPGPVALANTPVSGCWTPGTNVLMNRLSRPGVERCRPPGSDKTLKLVRFTPTAPTIEHQLTSHLHDATLVHGANVPLININRCGPRAWRSVALPPIAPSAAEAPSRMVAQPHGNVLILPMRDAIAWRRAAGRHARRANFADIRQGGKHASKTATAAAGPTVGAGIKRKDDGESGSECCRSRFP